MLYITPPPNFHPAFETVSCFCMYKNEFLLLCRQAHKPQGGTWGVPAGKRDANEPIKEAMSRELFEETGLRVSADDFEFLATTYITFPTLDFIYHIFKHEFNERPSISITVKEHSEYRWVTKEEARKLDLIQDLEPCLAYI